MCDDHEHDEEAAQAELGRHPVTLGRRGFLAGLGGVLGVGLLPGQHAVAAVTPAALAASPSGLSSLRAAMHVHASWSEQNASWRAQFDQASRNGLDVLWMTDHDHLALAQGFLTSLNNCPMTLTTTGTLATYAATNTSGVVRLAARAASSTPATVTYGVQDLTARNSIRTGIAGTTVTLTFGACQVDTGGNLEVVVTLSQRPAQGPYPAGTYSIRYSFQAEPTGYSVGSDGRTGRVSLAVPPAGTVVGLDPSGDFARLWPTLHAADNGFYGLSFVAMSGQSTCTVDCTLQSVRITRTQNNEASIIARQQEIIDAYRADFPLLTTHPSVEVSTAPNAIPHCNIYGSPQQFVSKKGLTTSTYQPVYQSIIQRAHDQGGVVSWNHPYGPTGGPAVADQDGDRRRVFEALWSNQLLGADILEVGYTIRGRHDFASHLALWDTFSRRGRFLTGNGVNDDHHGIGWAGLGNGFITGIWAPTTAASDLAAALAGGRAYTLHPARWPRGAVDLVSGSAVMGQVNVSPGGSRVVTVWAENLPWGSTLELLRGVVDYAGSDPLNTVTAVPATAFGSTSSGAVDFTVDTTTECYVRAQVRLSSGLLVGTSNPLWLLQTPPPGGVPAARTVLM